MTETKEQELNPMEFKDLTADYIMSQEWYCDDPDYGGVFINYHSATFGRVVKCGILSPNSNFKYPEVYQRLCERICEEHNENLRRTAPQWSQEPPDAQGQYWVSLDPANPRLTEPCLVRIFRYDNVLRLRNWYDSSVELTLFCKRHPNAQWCRIDTPEPPLPTEGRAE
jgi:hypothetical protein